MPFCLCVLVRGTNTECSTDPDKDDLVRPPQQNPHLTGVPRDSSGTEHPEAHRPQTKKVASTTGMVLNFTKYTVAGQAIVYQLSGESARCTCPNFSYHPQRSTFMQAEIAR